MSKPVPTVAGATVTISEASTMTGRPPSTIRDWIKKGVIHGEQDEKGRWLLDRVTVVAAAATAPTAARAVASQIQQANAVMGAAATTPDTTAARYIDSLQETVAREREENKELRSRIRDLEQERTQHLAEMRAILSKDVSGREGVLSRWIRK